LEIDRSNVLGPILVQSWQSQCHLIDFVVQFRVYSKFVDHFGTHFSRKTEFGSSIQYHKFMNSRSYSTQALVERQECMDVAVEACGSLGGSFQGASANLGICSTNEFNACMEQKGNGSFSSDQSTESMSIMAAGTLPVGEGNTLNDKDFASVPVQHQVEPLINLINERNLAESADYGFAQALDHNKIRQFFTLYNRQFCTDYLGLTPAQCGQTFSGMQYVKLDYNSCSLAAMSSIRPLIMAYWKTLNPFEV
jgi:hypothetical protein